MNTPLLKRRSIRNTSSATSSQERALQCGSILTVQARASNANPCTRRRRQLSPARAGQQGVVILKHEASSWQELKTPCNGNGSIRRGLELWVAWARLLKWGHSADPIVAPCSMVVDACDASVRASGSQPSTSLLRGDSEPPRMRCMTETQLSHGNCV